jgi:fructose-1,6-bisphosphatase/inositol monophosphatase family enzyme
MMNNQGDDMKVSREWLSKLKSIIERCIVEIPRSLETKAGREIVAVKPDGDPSLQAEILCENLVTQKLEELALPVILYSEEQGYLIKRRDARFVVLLDPIDGTFFALRKLVGGCIGISVHEASTMNPVAAVVGDYCHKDLYWASPEGAFHNGEPIQVSRVTDIDKAFISTNYGKYSRFGKMLDRVGVVEGAGWVETTGSILSMVRVATGQIDAYFDFMLGYKPYDFAAGAYIASMAGAIVTDEKGSELHLPADFSTRCKFIIASSKPLHKFIINNYKK